MGLRKTACIMLASALILAPLTGCSTWMSDNAKKQKIDEATMYGKDAIGTWQLTSSDSDDENYVMSERDVADCERAGYYTYITFDDDATGTYVAMGTRNDITWSSSKSDGTKVTLNGSEVPVEISDDKQTMTVSDDTVTMHLKKVDKAPKSEDAENVDDGKIAVEDKDVTIADDDICHIQINDAFRDGYGNVGYSVRIENTGDEDITVELDSDSVSIGGKMESGQMSQSVTVGNYAETQMYVTGVTRPSQLTDVAGKIVVTDSDGNALRTYSFQL